MTGEYPNHEINYLAELMQDFPSGISLSPQDAFELIQTRYQMLESNIEPLAKSVKKNSTKWNRFPLNQLVVGDYLQPLFYYLLIRLLHDYLFNEILNNAGKFRKSKDAYSGNVGFGGFHQRKAGEFKFYGSSPERITDELKNAVFVLTQKNGKPIENGLEFYRRFVKIHPFYDGNGRIGRMILSVYLFSNNKMVKWREIEGGSKKNKFLKKLNKCHETEAGYDYDKYFRYLLNFFERYIIDLTELDQ